MWPMHNGLILLPAIALFLSACKPSTAQSAKNGESSQARSKAPASQDQQPIPFHTEESKRRKAIFDAARQQLLAGDWDALEKSAQAFRDSKESYIHGSWALKSFYLGVADIEYSLPDSQCVDFLNKIRAWVAAKPNSATARIALAHALTDYAWKARGIGWSDSVSEGGANLMTERLAEAQKVLEEAKKLQTKCPGWWDTAQTVALGQGWDKKAYFDVFGEAIKFEPSYIDFYSNAVLYLQPRWSGEEGESEKFIEEHANRRSAVEADVFYARMIWLLDLRRLDKNLFDAHPRLSWPRTITGFDELLRRYPDSLSVKSEYVRLCFKTQDKKRAKPLFQQIGLNMDMRVWLDAVESFKVYRKWALEE
jgi:hypothetical protein